MEPLQYDGCAEITVDSLDTWKMVLNDPEFRKVVRRKFSDDYIIVSRLVSQRLFSQRMRISTRRYL
jgi:hypothetical protein